MSAETSHWLEEKENSPRHKSVDCGLPLIQQLWFWSSDFILWILTFILHVIRAMDIINITHCFHSFSHCNIRIGDQNPMEMLLVLLLLNYLLIIPYDISWLGRAQWICRLPFFFLTEFPTVSNTLSLFIITVNSHAAWLVRHFLLWIPNRRVDGEGWYNFRKILEVPYY